ncbi:hypothetical protein [Pseudomonas fluorescens]|nr:hypothetical protein [Pseudomonas fluorescens]
MQQLLLMEQAFEDRQPGKNFCDMDFAIAVGVMTPEWVIKAEFGT